jgi:hypothetical protein
MIEGNIFLVDDDNVLNWRGGGWASRFQERGVDKVAGNNPGKNCVNNNLG